MRKQFNATYSLRASALIGLYSLINYSNLFALSGFKERQTLW